MTDEQIHARILAKVAEMRKTIKKEFGPNPTTDQVIEGLVMFLAGALVWQDVDQEMEAERKKRGIAMKEALAGIGKRL